jgi:hypothetical protein
LTAESKIWAVSHLSEKTSKSELFSLAFDATTDVSDTPDTAVVIYSRCLQGFRGDRGTTQCSQPGENIFKEVEKSFTSYNLQWNQLKCITIDGGENVCGSKRGLFGQIYKARENEGSPEPKALYCIIHQQVLRGKACDIQCVTGPVEPAGNFVTSHVFRRDRITDS